MKFSVKSLGLTVILAASCGKNATPSQVKHDVNEPVRKNSKAWLWADDTEAEYLAWGNASDPSSLLGEKKFLPADHVMTRRLQSWLNELDAKVRSNDPEMMAMVPKPVIHVQLTQDANAFVTAIPVCYDNVSIRFDQSENSGTRDGMKQIAFLNDGQIYGGTVAAGHTPTNTPECRHTTLDAAGLEERVAYLNETETSCKLKANDLGGNQFEVVANSKCVLSGGIENAANAAVFGLFATSKHVTYFSGMLKLNLMGEAETVAILAHELGHYYRAHIGSGNKDYNFIYDAAGLNPSERPVPVQGSHNIRALASKSTMSYGVMNSRMSDLRSNIPADKLVPIAGSTLHPTVLPVLRELIQVYSTSDIMGCSLANDIALEIEGTGKMGLFFVPLAELNVSDSEALVEWEELAKTCIQAVDLSKDVAPNAVEAIEVATASWRFAREAAKPIKTEGSLLDWLNAIDVKVKAAYETAVIEPATTFSLEALIEAAIESRNAVLTSQKIAEFMTEKKLGLYTGEQEADELAVEWTNELGLDVHTSGNLGMAFLKAFHSDDAYNACNEKRSNGWLEADGSVSFVSWNEILLDPHPASCYRVRDSDLEVTAHGFKNPAEGPRKVATAAEWKALTDTIPAVKSAGRNGLQHNDSAKGIFANKPKIGCKFNHQHKH